MKDFRNRLAPLASLLLALALCGWMPQAMATAPNDAQIDQLLEVTRSRATLEAMLPQIEASQQQMLQQMLAGTTLDAKQREVVDRIFTRSRTLMSEALAWEKMLPVYRQLYGRSLHRRRRPGADRVLPKPGRPAPARQDAVAHAEDDGRHAADRRADDAAAAAGDRTRGGLARRSARPAQALIHRTAAVGRLDSRPTALARCGHGG